MTGNNRSTDVPDDSNLDASGVEQRFERGHTSQQGAQGDDWIARLGRLETDHQVLRSENEQLKRQLQSQDDRLSARLKGEWRDNKKALTKAAEIEGWDEQTFKTKLEAANQKSLSALSLSDLEQLERGDLPPAPEARAAQGAPLGDAADHATFLRQQLSVIGLTEYDLKAAGGNGLADFVNKPQSAELLREWTKRTAKALELREELARELAARRTREQDAEEVAREVEEYGNLGGTTSGSGVGGTPSNNLQRMMEQEMKKYRGTGDVAGALEAKERLEQRYGRG